MLVPVYERVGTRTILSAKKCSGVSGSVNMAYVGVTSKPAVSKVNRWREKIAAKEDASSGYSTSIVAIKSTPGWGVSSMKRYYCDGGYIPAVANTIFYNPENVVSNLYQPPSSLTTEAYNLCVEGLRRKIEKVDPRTLTLAMAYELDELHSTFAAMVRLLEVFAGRLSAARSMKAVAEAWLAFVWGLKPLADDAKGIAEAIGAANTDYPNHVVRYTAFRDSHDRLVRPNWGNGYVNSTSYHAIEYSVECTGTAGIRVRSVEGQVFKNLANGLGIGSVLELVPTSWELIPFSWLIDYFTNIGDVLNDTYGFVPDTVYCTVSTRISTYVDVQHQFVTPAGWPWQLEMGEPPSKAYTSITYSRVPYTAVPSRTLTMLPLHKIASLKHLLNLIALLVSKRLK